MVSDMAGSVLLEGPWDQGFALDVPMALLSKSNDRRFRRGSASTRHDFASFGAALGWSVRAARPAGWILGDPSEPLASRPSVIVVITARSLLDAGNFSKSVLDGLEGVLFWNDASVRATASVAERGRSGSFRLAVARLPGDTSSHLLASALSGLVSQVEW